MGFPCGSACKEFACNAGDLGLTPGLETWVQSLGWEDPLQKEKATHSSILAQRIPWRVHGVAKSWTRLTLTFTHSHLSFSILSYATITTIIEYFHHSRKKYFIPQPSVLSFPHPQQLQPQVATSLFPCLQTYLFCMFYINKNDTSCDPLLPASCTWHNVFKCHPCYSMYQYFISFYAKIFHYMNISLFIYPFVSWQTCVLLTCFHFLTIMNNAAMDIGIQIFEDLFSVLLVYTQEGKVLGRMLTLYLIF